MLDVENSRSLFIEFQVRSLFMANIVRRQFEDLDLQKLVEKLSQSEETDYVVRQDDALTKEGRLCIPNIKNLEMLF